jgi:hypothetical protein
MWKEYNKTWTDFRKDGFNKSGTLIDTSPGKFLIGDMNELCGVCDDCCMFADDTIVLRYKVVYKK